MLWNIDGQTARFTIRALLSGALTMLAFGNGCSTFPEFRRTWGAGRDRVARPVRAGNAIPSGIAGRDTRDQRVLLRLPRDLAGDLRGPEWGSGWKPPRRNPRGDPRRRAPGFHATGRTHLLRRARLQHCSETPLGRCRRSGPGYKPVAKRRPQRTQSASHRHSGRGNVPSDQRLETPRER